MNYKLVADVGGTNCNFAIMQNNSIIKKIDHKSKEITNFASCVSDIVNEWPDVSTICIAAAGPTDGETCKVTYLPWTISREEIVNITGINEVKLINDFVAITHGINSLNKDSIEVVHEGIKRDGPKLVIGAGTGLGICFSFGEEIIPSEGGHSPAIAVTDEEKKVIKLIQEKENHEIVVWNDVLSGRGISYIYQSIGGEDCTAKEISGRSESDKLAVDTFRIFAQFYARCVQQSALYVLPTGGVYIGGGIAMKNKHILNTFMEEFLNSKKLRPLLKEIPIYLIKDYDVSLYGANRCLTLMNGN